MGQIKPLAIFFVKVAVCIAIINRVPKVKSVVYGA